MNVSMPDYSSTPLLSIIVPMHNAVEKMGLCLDSLARLEHCISLQRVLNGRYVEILFIDDFSTDGTYEILQDECKSRSNWRLLRTNHNTGSPSTPRNMGLGAATGEFVFFLDGDDELAAEGIAGALAMAEANDYDVVRGPVEIYYRGDRRVLVDQIHPPANASVSEMMVAIARGQSLNCSALWRKSLLKIHELEFDSGTRMGEDIVFTAAALSKADSIGYVDTPLFHYVRQPGGGGSSMHYFSGRELRELVTSWQSVEDYFASQGLSYLELHGDRTVNYALRLIIRYHDRDKIADEDLEIFSNFFQRNAAILSGITFKDPHVKEMVSTLATAEPAAFWSLVKPRLLIAGHDLKFIKPAIPLLRQRYQIRIDEWPTEVIHNARQSSEMLAWADFVWVEWLTAAAVWYADRIKPTQDLIVRMHRYELGRSYGDRIRQSAVSTFVAIAPHCLEDMIERFSFDRVKVRFIPNFYFVDKYEKADPRDESRIFRLAMIGAVPQRKGYLQALELLARLRSIDKRFTLSVLGKQPSDFPWVANDPLEQAYFSSCEDFIQRSDLEAAVEHRGWSNTLTTSREFGFVLSMSEHEGSHVGPGEAFCAGNQGVFLPWRGVEYVYPESAVFSDVSVMAEYILAMRDPAAFNEAALSGQRYMRENYDVDLFVNRVHELLRSLG